MCWNLFDFSENEQSISESLGNVDALLREFKEA